MDTRSISPTSTRMDPILVLVLTLVTATLLAALAVASAFLMSP